MAVPEPEHAEVDPVLWLAAALLDCVAPLGIVGMSCPQNLQPGALLALHMPLHALRLPV
jgi:hypothetical protein